jgi:hypothetical protein
LIDNQIIEQVSSLTFLGVHIHEHQDWKPRINIISLKIVKSVGAINKIKSLISATAWRTPYTVLWYYHIFNIATLSGQTCTYSINLENMLKHQKRAIRIIANVGYRDHTKPLFLKLKLLTIYDINKLQTGSLMYRCIFTPSTLPTVFQTYFTFNSGIHNHNTRIASKIHVSQARTKTRQMTLRQSEITLWNSLDDSIIHATSLQFFQKKV